LFLRSPEGPEPGVKIKALFRDLPGKGEEGGDTDTATDKGDGHL
jgi:hypothetical protein